MHEVKFSENIQHILEFIYDCRLLPFCVLVSQSKVPGRSAFSRESTVSVEHLQTPYRPAGWSGHSHDHLHIVLHELCMLNESNCVTR